MGVSIDNSESSSRSSRFTMSGHEGLSGINEINITPFVDVVLVLLVIFIVTAPMMMKDIVPLNLPKMVQAEAQSLSTLAIVVTKTGQFLVNGTLLTEQGLAEYCQQAFQKSGSSTQAVLSADVDSRHGDVMKAIEIVKTAGISQFAIQVEKIKE